ncbi:MAG: transposase [Proteobacteria bacterium]|nr:transposase [Pseudomonadota bacterium]MBU1056766.1 transposase [Pseudomonadota bacterium]
MTSKSILRKKLLAKIHNENIKLRKHLNFDAFAKTLRQDFEKIPDHRAKNASIPLSDALMSGFAMFSLKAPSLLAFEERWREDPVSLHGVYGVVNIPCDSQMRTICDEVDPKFLRKSFRSIFRQLQRGKALEQMTWRDDHYLLALDGTGIYSSEKVSSPYCLKKTKRNGREEYYQQMLGAAIVHPDRREVIPLCPEMIVQQDGTTKQDCERKAAKRFLAEFRREHPHLKCVVIEDGISSNAPHIADLREYGLPFILGAKPGDHAFLFEQMDLAEECGEAVELSKSDPIKKDILHTYRFVNGVPLNKSNQDVLVNLLEYWQVDGKGKLIRFSWVTDLEITKENVYDIMRAGRARWRIENETFNTLKNQGYNLGHNYGLGKKHLSSVFVHLMMLAFLVDQVQQLCCPLFQAARMSCRCQMSLWEKIRSKFNQFICPSMEAILRAVIDKKKIPIPSSR